MAFSTPVVAASLAFVAYTSSSREFDVAVIFASFSLFQLLRQPLMFLPRALSSIADTRSAITRLENLFNAELKRKEDELHIDITLKEAIRVEKTTFEWEESLALDATNHEETNKIGRGSAKHPVKDDRKDDNVAPFTMKDVDLVIPRGQLVAIVGPVGSGKVPQYS